ncbi:MAG: bifunctional DNA-formamidopyrimidine glycosylase/DNA-(apurinic or apyrimidinic site) lyase [Candidatus Komeilibacteria bacterium]
MPELPEVETICRDLEKKIINKKIISVSVKKPNLIKQSATTFKKKLIGNKVMGVDRRGKLIILNLKSKDYLLIHLKMTGQLIYQVKDNITAGGHGLPRPEQGLPNKFSHIIFTFSDKSQLFFNDMRQFGYMQIVNKKELDNILNGYGIEPGLKNFTLDNFNNVLKNRSTSIKALLLNQKIVAGIGNIYADEICHKSGVKPMRKVNTLTSQEKRKLYQNTKLVIASAIKKRGTTFSDYVDADGHSGSFVNHLRVFGRQGENCKTCKKGVIKKIKHAGRGTHYCPNCQK